MLIQAKNHGDVRTTDRTTDFLYFPGDEYMIRKIADGNVNSYVTMNVYYVTFRYPYTRCSRVFQSCLFHPCDLVPCFPVLPFPLLRFGPTFSSPAFSASPNNANDAKVVTTHPCRNTFASYRRRMFNFSTRCKYT